MKIPKQKKNPKTNQNKKQKKPNKQTKKKQRMISEMIIPKLGFSMDEIKHLTNQTLFDFFINQNKPSLVCLNKQDST